MGQVFPSFGQIKEFLSEEARKHVLERNADEERRRRAADRRQPPPPSSIPPVNPIAAPPPASAPASASPALAKAKPPSAARVDAYNPVLEKHGQTAAQRLHRKQEAEQKTEEEEEDEEGEGAAPGKRPLLLREPQQRGAGEPASASSTQRGQEDDVGEEKDEDEGAADTDVADSVDAQSAMAAESVVHAHLDTAPGDPRFIGQPDQARYCWALYNTYLKCIDRQGLLDDRCLFLHKSSAAICPTDWVATAHIAQRARSSPHCH